MKIKRNAQPSQAWDITFRQGDTAMTYRVNTPASEDDTLAIKRGWEKMKADTATWGNVYDGEGGQIEKVERVEVRRPRQVWTLDGKPAPKKCKGAVPHHE